MWQRYARTGQAGPRREARLRGNIEQLTICTSVPANRGIGSRLSLGATVARLPSTEGERGGEEERSRLFPLVNLSEAEDLVLRTLDSLN